MANKAPDKIPPGPKLDALTAEKVFGWKNVHKHEASLVGKKQDKAGRWRLAKVPYYSTNPVHALSVDDRMKQLGRLDRYQKELAKITRSKNMPSEWASPDQRCRAAIKSVGRYGQVIPLSSGRNHFPPAVAKTYVVTFRSHNDDRRSKFIVLADNMKSAINVAWEHGGPDFQARFNKSTERVLRASPLLFAAR
jgi:hypothetical protein